MDEEIRDQLAGLTGSARTQLLFELGRRSAERYWRTGPGTPAALPHLKECIEALDEAYGYIPRGDALRAQIGLFLGLHLAAMRGAHNGDESFRDRAIRVLEESVAVRNAPPMELAAGRFNLGQLLLDRALKGLPSMGQPSGMPGGFPPMGGGFPGGFPAMPTVPPEALADVDQAQVHLRAVAEEAPVAEMASYARTMLILAEALAAILGSFGGGPFGMDLGRMAQAMSTLQGLRSGSGGLGLPGMGVPGMGMSANQAWGVAPEQYAAMMAKVAPSMRTIPVVHGVEPAPEAPEPAAEASATPPPSASATVADAPKPAEAPPVVPVAVTPVKVNVAVAREEVRRLLPDGSDLWESLAKLLEDAADPPAALDDLVAVATTVVHGAAKPSGFDHLVLAAALHLRGLRDDGGWGEDDEPGDAEAAAASLLDAAETLPDTEPESVPVLIHLAASLPDGTVGLLSAKLTGLTPLLKRVGADALVFPEPAESWLWNAGTGRLEAVGDGGAERLVVVGDRPPPWAEDAVVTCVASLGQLETLSRRQFSPLTRDVLFVVNPRGDREAAAVQTMLLRRACYPESVGLGRLIEDSGGAGSPEQVRARLGASMLHLDCGVTPEGVLELADGAELAVAGLGDTSAEAAGGLAILPPGVFLPLADHLVAAGFAGVVGWLRPVSAPVAAVLAHVLHTELADRGRSPAEAVREVHRWIAAPRPDALPTLLAGHVAQLAELPGEDAAVLVYRGR